MAKEYTKDELSEWFKNKALTAKSGNARNKLLAADERFADINSEFVGNMYFFRYDPKFKSVLPMYDKYPLAIVIERYTDGFLALNMHYLTKAQRRITIGLMNDFYERKKPFKGTTTGRGLTNWEQLINSSTGVESMAQKSVHRYLYKQCRSQFIKINKDEYEKAVQLPIDEWVYKR